MATAPCRSDAWWQLLLRILMHSRGKQSVQVVISVLHHCPLLMVLSSWVCQAVCALVCSWIWSRLTPSIPNTQYLAYKCWISSVSWYWGCPQKEYYISHRFAHKSMRSLVCITCSYTDAAVEGKLTSGNTIWVVTKRIRSWIKAAVIRFLYRISGHTPQAKTLPT